MPLLPPLFFYPKFTRFSRNYIQGCMVRLSHLVKGKGNSILIYFIFFSPPLISFKETDKVRLEEKEEEEEEEEGFFAFQEFSLIRR